MLPARLLHPTSLLLALAPSALAQNAMWMSHAEAVQCPATGLFWDAMVADANAPIAPTADNMNDNSDVHTLAVALVWLRLPDSPPYPAPPVQPKVYYLDKVVSICDAVSDTPLTDTEALARNP